MKGEGVGWESKRLYDEFSSLNGSENYVGTSCIKGQDDSGVCGIAYHNCAVSSTKIVKILEYRSFTTVQDDSRGLHCCSG